MFFYLNQIIKIQRLNSRGPIPYYKQWADGQKSQRNNMNLFNKSLFEVVLRLRLELV